MRIILYTGKGGVGKTSVAASTALRSAQMGYKTIAISTDAAHSLADSFDLPLGNEPKKISANLWGQEPELSHALATHWGTIQQWVMSLLSWRGIDEIIAGEMAVLPGMEELANLLYILDYYEKGQFDVIIVDCAPTGETLRLLSFPEILRWWMDRIFPIQRKAATLLRPMVKGLTDIPFPSDQVFKTAEMLFTQLEKMRAVFTDPEITSVRLVVNPEKMVIKEAQRTYTYLNLYGYATDLIVCNRVIPPEVSDPYFDVWKQRQSQHFRSIEERFSPIPIRTIPLFSSEVVGIETLRSMAGALFGQADPTQVFFRGQPQTLSKKKDGCYVLSLTLPFITKHDLTLNRKGDELIIEVGAYRRNIMLPLTLLDLPVHEAKFIDNQLQIHFVPVKKARLPK